MVDALGTLRLSSDSHEQCINFIETIHKMRFNMLNHLNLQISVTQTLEMQSGKYSILQLPWVLNLEFFNYDLMQKMKWRLAITRINRRQSACCRKKMFFFFIWDNCFFTELMIQALVICLTANNASCRNYHLDIQIFDLFKTDKNFSSLGGPAAE